MKREHRAQRYRRTLVSGVLLSLLCLTTPSGACPGDENAPDATARFTQSGSVWELQLPHGVLHHGWPPSAAKLGTTLSAALSRALSRHERTLALMDEIGRRQGVVVIGVGAAGPFLVVPSGRSPFARVVALALALPATPARSLTDMILEAAASSRAPARAAWAALLPDYPVTGRATQEGKLVASECNIGPREKFLLLALDDGRVALLSRAGLLSFDASMESRLTSHARALGPSEGWRIERHDPYTLSLKSSADTYLRWGARDFFELDARARELTTAPLFENNHERFFLWVNGDGTVSLKLPNNRISVSVAEWQVRRQGIDGNCHYYGYRQDPSERWMPLSVSLGSAP